MIIYIVVLILLFFGDLFLSLHSCRGGQKAGVVSNEHARLFIKLFSNDHCMIISVFRLGGLQRFLLGSVLHGLQLLSWKNNDTRNDHHHNNTHDWSWSLLRDLRHNSAYCCPVFKLSSSWLHCIALNMSVSLVSFLFSLEMFSTLFLVSVEILANESRWWKTVLSFLHHCRKQILFPCLKSSML